MGQEPRRERQSGSGQGRFPVQRIISGGQTGVDRAALDVAIELGIPHGGWCPRGRRAEDGTIPPHYQLQETDSPQYAERTERNVLEADGTLILYVAPMTGGTFQTRQLAQQHGKPWLAVDLEKPWEVVEVRRWIRANRIGTLNVAGPRESQRPGVYDMARQALRQILAGPVTPAPKGGASG